MNFYSDLTVYGNATFNGQVFGLTNPTGNTGCTGLAGLTGFTGCTGPVGTSYFTQSGSNIYYTGGNVGVGKIPTNGIALDVLGNANVSANLTANSVNLINPSSSITINNLTSYILFNPDPAANNNTYQGTLLINNLLKGLYIMEYSVCLWNQSGSDVNLNNFYGTVDTNPTGNYPPPIVEIFNDSQLVNITLPNYSTQTYRGFTTFVNSATNNYLLTYTFTSSGSIHIWDTHDSSNPAVGTWLLKY
jgi:hypothetical protein